MNHATLKPTAWAIVWKTLGPIQQVRVKAKARWEQISMYAALRWMYPKKYAKFMKEVESTVGRDRIKVLHLNDSKKPLGSRVDRHDHIGRGLIGIEGFKPIVRDRAFKKVPKILETPKDGKCEDGREWDAVNIEVLKGLMD